MQCMYVSAVYLQGMNSLHCTYTAGILHVLQCTLHGTAGTLHFGLGIEITHLVAYVRHLSV